ncbi:MAG: YcxB family protein [Bacteroidales bacterium]|nr:YcxB family protein [Bacteroidales bacterium]
MEVKVELNWKDYLAFNKYIFIRKRIKNSFLIATIFVLLWLFILNYNKPFDVLLLLVEAIIFFAAWAVLIFIIFLLNFYRIKKIPGKNGAILGAKTYSLTDEGFKETGENLESIVKWIGIKKVVESGDYIYVFVDRMAAYIIPVRYFDSQEQKAKFLQSINQRISR